MSAAVLRGPDLADFPPFVSAGTADAPDWAEAWERRRPASPRRPGVIDRDGVWWASWDELASAA